MDNEIFQKISAKIKNLPTLPVVASKILEVTEDPESTIAEVKNIITMDQVVASRLLKAVNSAYYGFPRTIDSLSQAIVILGFNNVRSLALSVAVMDLFAAKHGGSVFKHHQLWHHSVGTAFIARAIAKMHAPRMAEQCFVAGLLHDLGFVPMEQVAANQLLMAIRVAGEKQITVYEAEKQVFGFTHADVGSHIAEQWLLPSNLREAIQLHHEPSDSPDHPYILLATHTADIISRMRNFACFDNEPPASLKDICEQAREMFEIKDALPKEVEEFLKDDLDQARGFISIFN